MPVLRLALGAAREASDVLADLAPLRTAWVRSGWRVVVSTGWDPGDPVAGSDADAVLAIGPRSRSPRRMLPGPVLDTGDRVVPIGWLPDTGPDGVRRFAAAAAAVHGRAAVGQAAGRSLAVLGQRHPRYDDLAGRIARLAGEQPGLAVTRLTAYEVHRDDLAATLAAGPAVAVYVGHGRPSGWSGYAGVRAEHLVGSAQPVAAVLSLTCHVASRHRVGLSFAEALVVQGVTASALAAIGPTLHTANARWALRLGPELSAAATVGDLVAAIAPHDPGAASYRLIGDPTAPLLDGPQWADANRKAVA